MCDEHNVRSFALADLWVVAVVGFETVAVLAINIYEKKREKQQNANKCMSKGHM